MDNKKIVRTGKSGEVVEPGNTDTITSEVSLLAQIHAKEEEQNERIETARQQYVTDVENARKDAESWLSRERTLIQTEADSVWREAMARINRDVERVLSEGQQRVHSDHERKERRFGEVVDRVVREISKG